MNRNTSVVSDQRAKALENEVQVLKLLARFSWLTSQQLGLLIWGHSKNANQMSNRTLKRLLDKEMIMTEQLNESFFSDKYNAYYLSPRGKMYLESFFSDIKINGYFGSGRKNEKGEIYYLMDRREHYHRFITNQFIIELELYDIYQMWQGEKNTFNESRLIAHKKRFKNTLGSVPDSFFVVNNEVGYVVETENVKRGPRKHGAKFYDFMTTFFEQMNISEDGVYRPSVHELPAVAGDKNGTLNTKIIFICRTEDIFRNIYRKVQRIAEEVFQIDEEDLEFSDGLYLANSIYYLILSAKKEYPKNLDDCELLDHQYCEERVRNGSRKYKYSDEKMVSILEEYRDNDVTVREICDKYNINSSNFYRWNKRFKIFETKQNTAKPWG